MYLFVARLAKAISDGQHCINLLIFILFMYVRLIISANKVVVVVVVVVVVSTAR